MTVIWCLCTESIAELGNSQYFLPTSIQPIKLNNIIFPWPTKDWPKFTPNYSSASTLFFLEFRHHISPSPFVIPLATTRQRQVGRIPLLVVYWIFINTSYTRLWWNKNKYQKADCSTSWLYSDSKTTYWTLSTDREGWKEVGWFYVTIDSAMKSFEEFLLKINSSGKAEHWNKVII